jgi:hypothetical protein
MCITWNTAIHLNKSTLQDPEILQKNTEGIQTGEVDKNVFTALLYGPDINAGSFQQTGGWAFWIS